MKMKDICTTEVVSCVRTLSAGDAARMMRQKHVGDLVVVDDPDGTRIPAGIVTDRDLVIEVMGKGVDPAAVTVAELMRTPVVVAEESEDLSQVIQRMHAHGVRRIPVVDHRGSIAGIVTLDDALRHLVGEANALLGILAKEHDRELRMRR
jgi:CBS domain-containing protein